MGDTNNGVSRDTIWGRVMAKKKECKTAVLAVLDAPNSGMLVCHCKAKGLATATKKKAKIAKKAAEEQKKVVNPIGAQLKKAVLAGDNATLAMAKSELAMATSESRKVAEANMLELRMVSEAMMA